MGDIYLGLLILLVLAACLFQAGRAVGKVVSERGLNLLVTLTFGGLVAYTFGLWDEILLARLLPVTNLIVLGNWFPLAGGFMGGLAFTQPVRTTWRRWLPMCGLETAAFATVLWPLLGQAPVCGNEWDNTGICLQTTEKSCSAAAAATLLTMHGIPATEQEMAELCFTRTGTNWMGLYRGLRKKTANTAWDVEPFACSAEDLLAFDQPAILCVGLSKNSHVDPAYQTEWGWTPGVRHSVVLLGFLDSQQAEIGEPANHVGRDRWTIETLRQLFQGQGLRLVRRDDVTLPAWPRPSRSLANAVRR